MAKQNKTVSINIFHILKSVMDKKVKTLPAIINAGQRAATEEQELCEHISNLNEYIRMNRYDRGAVMDAEAEIADYEQQATAVRTKITRGVAAQQDMNIANKFYDTYNVACEVTKQKEPVKQRSEMDTEYNQIMDRMSKLDDRMFACEVNMDSSERNEDVCAQARADRESYQAEYNTLQERLNKIIAEMSHTR